MTLSDVKEQWYLIIGGAVKAGTTSLFSYLAEHPQICASNMKETRFFIDPDYPLPPNKPRFEDGLDKYEEFFCHCPDGKLRMEATPNYIYSPGTPQRIKDSLPNVGLVFSLREPVSRLISWYSFVRQAGRISEQTFDEFIERQIQGDMRILRQGFYSIYLKPYFDLFGRSRIHVIFSEDLFRDPESIVKGICIFAGIDPEFYSDYNFKILNPAKTMKNTKLHRVYTQLRYYIGNHTHNKSHIYKVVKGARLLIEPLYFRLNTRSSEKPVISTSAKAFLDDYYSQEADALAHLLQRPVPWQSKMSSLKIRNAQEV